MKDFRSIFTGDDLKWYNDRNPVKEKSAHIVRLDGKTDFKKELLKKQREERERKRQENVAKIKAWKEMDYYDRRIKYYKNRAA